MFLFMLCFFSKSFFLGEMKYLECLTCCDGGHRSHIRTPPLSSGCGVPFLPAEVATCPCMSHEPLAAVSSSAIWATYHLTRGTTPSSSSLSAEWLTAQPLPRHPYLQQQTQTCPHLHTSLEATQTHPQVHAYMLPFTLEAHTAFSSAALYSIYGWLIWKPWKKSPFSYVHASVLCF